MALPLAKLTVINQALLALGSSPVANETESEAAKFISEKLDSLLPILLLSETWRFAVKYREESTPLTQNFSPDYRYTYQLLFDYGRFIKLAGLRFNLNVILDFEIVDNLILTNSNPFRYYYLVSTLDYSILPPIFARTLALYAAADSAIPLTQNVSLAQLLNSQYLQEKMNALLLNNMGQAIKGAPYNDFDRVMWCNMTTELIRQAMFTRGEVDAINYHRTDFQDYLTTAQSLLNVEAGNIGLAKKRKGTRFLIQITNKDLNSKLCGFQDKNGQFYLFISLHKQFDIYKIKDGAWSPELTLIQSITTPYFSSDLRQLDYTSDNDSLILVHKDYPPARITIKDYDKLSFVYEVLNLYPLPAYDFGDVIYNKGHASISGDAHTITLTLTQAPGFTADWIGGQIIGGGTSDVSPLGYAIITKVSYNADTVSLEGKVQIPFLIKGALPQPHNTRLENRLSRKTWVIRVK